MKIEIINEILEKTMTYLGTVTGSDSDSEFSKIHVKGKGDFAVFTARTNYSLCHVKTDLINDLGDNLIEFLFDYQQLNKIVQGSEKDSINSFNLGEGSGFVPVIKIKSSSHGEYGVDNLHLSSYSIKNVKCRSVGSINAKLLYSMIQTALKWAEFNNNLPTGMYFHTKQGEQRLYADVFSEDKIGSFSVPATLHEDSPLIDCVVDFRSINNTTIRYADQNSEVSIGYNTEEKVIQFGFDNVLVKYKNLSDTIDALKEVDRFFIEEQPNSIYWNIADLEGVSARCSGVSDGKIAVQVLDEEEIEVSAINTSNTFSKEIIPCIYNGSDLPSTPFQLEDKLMKSIHMLYVSRQMDNAGFDFKLAEDDEGNTRINRGYITIGPEDTADEDFQYKIAFNVTVDEEIDIENSKRILAEALSYEP